MNCKNWRPRFLTVFLALALLGVSTHVVSAGTELQEAMGQLTVTGKVRVNGQPAATGDIVSSGSLVETAAKSSSVVSLGKLGRVEALPETRMTLRYDDESISILLDTGSVRVQTGPGVKATIVTKE